MRSVAIHTYYHAATYGLHTNLSQIIIFSRRNVKMVLWLIRPDLGSGVAFYQEIRCDKYSGYT